jgi:hypothetical protein
MGEPVLGIMAPSWGGGAATTKVRRAENGTNGLMVRRGPWDDSPPFRAGPARVVVTISSSLLCRFVNVRALQVPDFAVVPPHLATANPLRGIAWILEGRTMGPPSLVGRPNTALHPAPPAAKPRRGTGVYKKPWKCLRTHGEELGGADRSPGRRLAVVVGRVCA